MTRMNPYTKRQLLREIMAAGGFYVTNCRPQAIPLECHRLDCPMRKLAIPPEADENDHRLECDPPGHLADLLLMLRATTPYLHPSRPGADEAK
ncbi:MAG: hypothetical protein HC875_16945 [Anaerolineales bacterium]|nr:hypothetical protein [Anaerolineales bacterium]